MNQINKPIGKRMYRSEAVASIVILMRHGQASYTFEEDHGGDIVEGTLTAEGINTIRQSSGEIVSVLEKAGVPTVGVISSPKRRCLESVDILEQVLTKRTIASARSVDAMLRDVTVIGPTDKQPGSYERWESDKKNGENWFSSWVRRSREGMAFYPGEERPSDVEKRVSSALPRYLTNGRPSILICHEEVFGAIASILQLEWTQPVYGEVWYISRSRLEFV